MLLSTSPFYIRLVLTIRTVPQLRCDQIVFLSSWTLSVSELNQGILMYLYEVDLQANGPCHNKIWLLCWSSVDRACLMKHPYETLDNADIIRSPPRGVWPKSFYLTWII